MVKVNLLSTPEIESIHQASLSILEDIGIRINNERVLKLLKDNGFPSENGNVVIFPREEIGKTIRLVSTSGFDIYDRSGNRALSLEKGNVYFGPGGGAPNILDLHGNRRASTKDDVEKVARISDYLSNVDFVMADVTAQDQPLQTQDLHELEAMVTNTTKPLVLVSLADGLFVEAAYRIYCTIRGEQTMDRPFMITYFQPSSPLQLDKDPLTRILQAMEYDFPMIISGALSAGGTAPVTLAGAVVTGNAEVLSAMTIARLVRPKPKLIYGIGGAALDMSTGNFCYGSPELGFLSGVAVAEMASFYGLPTWGRGACSDAKTLDAQFGFEVYMTAVLPVLSGINLIHDLGRVDFGKSGCLDALVLANEIVDCVRHQQRGFLVDEEHLAVEAVRQLGIGGSFLKSRHTLKHYHEQWKPLLFNRMDFSSWIKSPGKNLTDRVEIKTKEILESHRAQTLDPSVIKEISDIVKRYEKKIIEEAGS